MFGLEERNNYISFNACKITDREIMLSNLRGNGLFVIDRYDLHIKRIEEFINMQSGAQRYHRGICSWNKNIYFYPDASGQGIHKYNTETREQHFIETGSFSCSYAFVEDDKMILLPAYASDGIWSLDLKTDSISPVKWQGISDFEIGENFLISGKICRNRVWMAAVRTQNLFIVDLASGEVQRYVIGGPQTRLWLTAFDGRNYWFTLLNDKRIIRWSGEDGGILYYNVSSPEIKESPAVPYKQIIAQNGRIYVVDIAGIFCMDIDSTQWTRLTPLPPNIRAAINEWYVVYQVFRQKLIIYFCPTNLIVVIDLDTHATEFFDTTIKNSALFDKYLAALCEKKFQEFLEKDMIPEEDNADLANLNDFLKIVQCYNGERRTQLQSFVGKLIYKDMRS